MRIFSVGAILRRGRRSIGAGPVWGSAANGILSLLNLAILLLERQLAAQVRDFERNGGFPEHLGGVRKRALSGSR